ncbi:MAG: ABC transporter permease [Georgfuchsia sp.]
MLQFIVSAWRSGFRGRSFLAVFVLGLLLVGVAYLTGHFSPRQPRTVALDVGYSGLRFALILLSLFWVQELVGREIDRRTVIFALSYPVPRYHYILGRYCGILALSLAATMILGLALWLAVLLSGGAYQQQFAPVLGGPFWATLAGLWLQVAVVTAFSLWIASLSTVSILPLALGAAFAIAGNSIGAVREYLQRGADGDVELVARFGPLTGLSQWLVPDLSRLDWRPWPMYAMLPDNTTLFWAVLMALGYIALLLWLAVAAFSRREFS